MPQPMQPQRNFFPIACVGRITKIELISGQTFDMYVEATDPATTVGRVLPTFQRISFPSPLILSSTCL